MRLTGLILMSLSKVGKVKDEIRDLNSQLSYNSFKILPLSPPSEIPITCTLEHLISSNDSQMSWPEFSTFLMLHLKQSTEHLSSAELCLLVNSAKIFFFLLSYFLLSNIFIFFLISSTCLNYSCHYAYLHIFPLWSLIN
jgi:hypothetical protein